ncbi:formylglycine-generating enzyme family protein [Paenibacillus sp. GCM10012307]
MLEWIKIPSGNAYIGSSLEEINRAFLFWQDKLLDDRYIPSFKSFLMKEYPQRELSIPAFEISDVLIPNGLYQCYVEERNKSKPESLSNRELGGGVDCPVWGVSYIEAEDFCLWFGEQNGFKVSLPSEVQWEYAARGATKREYPWGDNWEPGYCNSFESGLGATTPVRYFEQGKSLFGLYDMAGNVEEWVSTRYGAYPGGEYIDDDIHYALGEGYQILKGGSFARGGDLCRVARRHGPFPSPEFRFTGFRVVRESRSDTREDEA